MGELKLFDSTMNQKLKGSAAFAEAMLNEMPVPDGLEQKVLDAMAERRESDEAKADVHSDVRRKVAMRITAVAALFHHWVDDVFELNMTKSNNGVKVKLVSARLANEYLYVTLQGVKEELGETDLIYIEGSISDNAGHTVKVEPQYYQGGWGEQYAVYIPDLETVINSYDKKYTCDLKVTIAKGSYTIGSENLEDGFSVLLFEDEFNKTAELNYRFKIEKISSVMNFKSYDIDRTMTFDEVYDVYRGIELTLKKLMVSDICTNIVAEITPPDGDYERYRWFSVRLVMKDSQGNYLNEYFEGSGTFYNNDKTYVVLNYYNPNDSFYEGEYITAPFAYEPPYEFEIAQLDFHGITFETLPTNYTSLEDVVIPITYQGYKAHTEPTTFQAGDFLIRLGEWNCDNTFWGEIPVTVTPLSYEHFGVQRNEVDEIEAYKALTALYGSGQSIVLAAEKKGKELFRFETRFTEWFDDEIGVNESEIDMNRGSMILAGDYEELMQKYDFTQAPHILFRNMGIDALRVISVNLYEESYPKVIIFEGNDVTWEDIMKSDYMQQFKDDEAVRNWKKLREEGDEGWFNESLSDVVDLKRLGPIYNEETETYTELFGVESSKRINVTAAFNTKHCDVNLDVLQRRGTCSCGTWGGMGVDNPFYDDRYVIDYESETSRWNREKYSFTVK